MMNKIFEKKEAFRFVFWGVVTTLFNYFSFFFREFFRAYPIAKQMNNVINKLFV